MDRLRVAALALFSCGAIIEVWRWQRRRARRHSRRAAAASLKPGAQAMLLGTAIGDAFGAGIEFQGAAWIRDEINVDFTRWVNVRGRYWTMNPLSSQNFFSGMYTDDTEMTVGLMKALMNESSASITEDMLINYWRHEYDLAKTHFLSTRLWSLIGVGRNGHGSIRWVYSGEKTLEQVRAHQRAKVLPGNAGPMRALPLAYVSDDVRQSLAITSSDATHPHPKSRIATYLIATCGAFLIRKGGKPHSVIRHAIEEGRNLKPQGELNPQCELKTSSEEIYDEETLIYLEELDALPDYHTYGPRQAHMPLDILCGPQPIPWATKLRNAPCCGLDSDAMHTVGVVLYLLKWHQGPMDALKHSVWIGGDVDSVAALVLGIIGASEGLGFGREGGLPFWLVDDLEAVEYLLGISERFSRSFPLVL